MFYRLLRCMFFYDKPILEITWTNESKTKTIIIYNNQFKRLKSMNDLFRYSKIPVYQKYTIVNEFRIINPWEPIIFFKELEIVVNNKKQFHVKMKRLYGNTSLTILEKHP